MLSVVMSDAMQLTNLSFSLGLNFSLTQFTVYIMGSFCAYIDEHVFRDSTLVSCTFQFPVFFENVTKCVAWDRRDR